MIESFQGEYRFLSNFWHAGVIYDGYAFPTSENAYQYAKLEPSCVTEQDVSDFQLATPGKAKRMGQKLTIREDWTDVKIGIMEEILRSKFEDAVLGWWLTETGTQTIVEGNTWNDTFWGVCNGVGSNHLGKLLMKIRKEFQQTDLDLIF
jgi:ribA/ribD-fused uncharacterized protein